MIYDRDEVLKDAERLSALLNELEQKYGTDLCLIADDPYCHWGWAGFIEKPSTGKPRLVGDAFEVVVENIMGDWVTR
jgi:hypothetical protein